jgi:uncharacterized metal-binding protein
MTSKEKLSNVSEELTNSIKSNAELCDFLKSSQEKIKTLEKTLKYRETGVNFMINRLLTEREKLIAQIHHIENNLLIFGVNCDQTSVTSK